MIFETTPTHPDFNVPSFGLIDFGSAATGIYSHGYKMIAFEPGKILQAQELNEIQFRMNIHTTLTAQMLSNWTNALIVSDLASPDATGPGWSGATPINPKNVIYKTASGQITFDSLGDEDSPYTAPAFFYVWFLCKTRSNGLYFWIPMIGDASSKPTINIANQPVGTFVGVSLNSSGGNEYTGELVNCEDIGQEGNHQLNVANSSTCGSSRYYVKIIGLSTSDVPLTNNFCAFAQKRSNGLYYLNNVKVQEG